MILGRGGAQGEALGGGKKRLITVLAGQVLAGQVGVMGWRKESADDVEAVLGLQRVSSAVEHRDVPTMNRVQRTGGQ